MDAGAGNALGAVIGGMFGMGQGAINNNQNKKAQGRAFNMQKALNEQGSQLAYDMWQKTNYKAQTEEMQKAGLNKALMYGSAGASGSTNAGSGGGAPQQAPTNYDVGGMAIQGAQAAANLQLTKAQKENVEASTNKTNVETSNIEEPIRANISKTLAERDKTEAEGNVARDTYDDQVLQKKAESVGAFLQNDLTKQSTYTQRKQLDQKAEEITQGWEKLNKTQQEIAIKKFEAELKAKYPSLDAVAGGQVNNLIETIYEILGLPRNSGKVK